MLSLQPRLNWRSRWALETCNAGNDLRSTPVSVPAGTLVGVPAHAALILSAIVAILDLIAIRLELGIAIDEVRDLNCDIDELLCQLMKLFVRGGVAER